MRLGCRSVCFQLLLFPRTLKLVCLKNKQSHIRSRSVPLYFRRNNVGGDRRSGVTINYRVLKEN